MRRIVTRVALDTIDLALVRVSCNGLTQGRVTRRGTQPTDERTLAGTTA